MRKRTINWLGCIVIIIYVLIFFALLFIGLKTSGSERGRILGISVCWLFVGIGLTPTTWYLTWMKILPVKSAKVRLISKSVNQNRYHIRGIPRTVTNLYLNFEFLDGSKWLFNVKPDIFNSVQENDEGILVFKGQGCHNYFVSFEK